MSIILVNLLSVLADNLAKKHTILVAHRGGRAGTQKAINSQKCELWMCIQFPPKNKEKIRKSARTHLAFRAMLGHSTASTPAAPETPNKCSSLDICATDGRAKKS